MSHYLKICSDCWAVILYAHNEGELHENRLTIEMGSCGGQCKVREYRDFPSWFVPPEKNGKKRVYARLSYSVSENGSKDTEKPPMDERYKKWLDIKGKGGR